MNATFANKWELNSLVTHYVGSVPEYVPGRRPQYRSANDTLRKSGLRHTLYGTRADYLSKRAKVNNKVKFVLKMEQGKSAGLAAC